MYKKFIVFSLIFLGFFVPYFSYSNSDITNILKGPARVVDGDTLEIKKEKVRLFGIAAPEKNTLIGKRSKEFLEDFLKNKEVKCILKSKDKYNRWVGICYLDNLDISSYMVENGFARDCPKFSKRKYKLEEENAIYNGLILKDYYNLPSYC